MNVISKWLIAVTSLLVVSTANAQNVHGVLRVVKGDVQIKTAKGETTRARIGGKVFPRDVVITGKDARAKIVMVDNNEINVSPETQIEIQHYEYDPNGGKKDVLLNVIYGKVRSKVEQKYDGKTSKFQIKTPSAVAGVRGTDFLMGFNKSSNTSQVVTFEGKVEFGMPGPGGSIANPVMVSPGMTAAANGGAPPAPPAPMPKEELAKMDSDTKADVPKANAPPASEPDKRAPAGDDKDKKDGGVPAPEAGAPAAGGDDGKSGDKGGQTGDNKSGGPPKSGEGPRGPASVGPGGPVAGEAGSTCTMCGGPPAPPPPMPINLGTPLPVLPNYTPTNSGTDQFIRDTIKDGSTNLIIKVTGQ